MRMSLLLGSNNNPVEPVSKGRPRILTINGGSSSLKFAIFDKGEPPVRVLSGRVDRIGLENARWVLEPTDGACKEDRRVDAPDQKAAVRLVIDWLDHSDRFKGIGAIGHRVVHGGSCYHQPERVTAELIEGLRKIRSFDPDHMPGEIELIEAFRKLDPDLPQVACFDTAFHHDMPRVARIVPIPRRFEAAGVRRYGFHGLSYAYLMEELARVAGPEEARGRVILAHLGSGASLAAVREGLSVDTTMGFTPASGLVMGTRRATSIRDWSGSCRGPKDMTADQFDGLVNHKSGLLGVSETSSDVEDLLARQDVDVRAAEAIELFCYRAKQGIGAFAATLGGLETLVFSGGIGEKSPEIRRRICQGLGFLGIAIDEGRNAAGALLISIDAGPVKVRVIRTDEELMIAKAAARLTARPS